MKIKIEDSYIGNIPALSIFSEKRKSMPLIIYLHGYGASKEQAVDFGYRLAKSGFFFLSFDCMDHGERKDKFSQHQNNKFGSVYPADTGLDTYVHMHEVIVSTKKDINVVLDSLQNNQRIDLDRIGLTGFSMGGYATFYNIAYSEIIMAAAPIAGKPAFKKAWDDSILSTSTYKQ